MKCPNCGCEISEGRQLCPFCGLVLPNTVYRSMGTGYRGSRGTSEPPRSDAASLQRIAIIVLLSLHLLLDLIQLILK